MKRKLISFLRILHSGTVNFIRNISIAVAAMAVMVVTLSILLFSVISNATFSNTINQITSKIDISVYLKNSVTLTDTNNLVQKLKKLPNVKSVHYLDKTQVLREYIAQNSSNHQLALAISEASNPLPPTIHIRMYDLNNISGIKAFLVRPSINSLQADPPSYSGSLQTAINNIARATRTLRELGIIAIIVFSFISVLIIFNTMQMAIFNRRDEIQIMRLLGASTAYIRGPFIVESSIYGLLSAVISIIIINSIFVTTSSTLKASSLGLLDINYATSYFDSHFIEFLVLQIIIGTLIGSVSAFIATRRYLKFKVRN